MNMTENIADWTDEVRFNLPLLNGKGIITAIQQPKPKETKFGMRKLITFVIEDTAHSQINVTMFLPPQFPAVHPKSNLGKMMRKYGCNAIKQLIGKEVEVVEVDDMMWKIKVE